MSDETKVDEIPISDRIDREAMDRGIFSIRLNNRTISVDATTAYRTLVADDEINLGTEMEVYRAEVSSVDLKAKAQGGNG